MRSEDKPYGRAFAQRIQIIRNVQGLTQLQLAARLGKPQSFVCKIESCNLMVTIDMVVALADALGIDPRKLFADAVEMGRDQAVVAGKVATRGDRADGY